MARSSSRRILVLVTSNEEAHRESMFWSPSSASGDRTPSPGMLYRRGVESFWKGDNGQLTTRLVSVAGYHASPAESGGSQSDGGDGRHDRPSPLVQIWSGRRHGSTSHAGTRITLEYSQGYSPRPVRGCGIPHFSSLVLGRGGTWYVPDWSLVRACMRSAGGNKVL